MVLGPDLTLAVLDISEGGIRLLLKGPLGKGEQIELSLDDTGQVEVFHIGAEVVWAQPTRGGRYTVGLRFLCGLRLSELRQLVGP